jgi:copper(I)-binding protein
MVRKALLTLLVAATALAACAPAGPNISVENVRGRASPMMANAGAFYMTLRNSGGAADQLIGVRTAACGVIELHETVMMADGTMGMRPVEGQAIEVPARGTVELKPGGLHVMCLERTGELAAGDQVPLTLLFRASGEMQVTAAITDEP